MTAIFDAYLATGQAGRIRPANYTPTEGEFVYVLGSDAPGALELLTPEDGTAILYTEGFPTDTDVDILRLVGKIRIPELPSGYWWSIQMTIGDATVGVEMSLNQATGFEALLTDFSCNVSADWLLGSWIVISASFHGPDADAVLTKLPAFYLDTLTTSEYFGLSTNDVAVIGTFPADGQTSVPADVPYGIQLSIAPFNDVLIDQATVYVTVDDVPAVVGGVVVMPFTGTVTDEAGASFLDTKIVLTGGWPTFPSEYTVEVEVSASTLDAVAISEKYRFYIIDYAPPTLVSARSLSDTEIELTFSEPVTQVSGVAGADALNPANYVLSAVTIPAAVPVVIGVTSLSATMVVLELDDGMSFGASYLITASNVTDLLGNIIIAPDNDAELIGFDPPWPACRSFDLWSMLAGVHRSSDLSGDLAKFISCLQDVLDQLLFSIDKWAEIIDPDTADEQYIDAMLAGLGNPFRFDLSLADKRLLISVLVSIYQSKGTAPGIENAVFLFLGFEIEIVPLNETDNAWILDVSELGEETELFTSDSYILYTFEVNVEIDLSDEQMAAMLTIIDYMKCGHEHIGAIHQPGDVPAPEFWVLGDSELDTETELGQPG